MSKLELGLEAMLARERAEKAEALAERRRIEREQALNVTTREGLSASEWLMRTAQAEARAEKAEAERDLAIKTRNELGEMYLLERERAENAEAKLAEIECHHGDAGESCGMNLSEDYACWPCYSLQKNKAEMFEAEMLVLRADLARAVEERDRLQKRVEALTAISLAGR